MGARDVRYKDLKAGDVLLAEATDKGDQAEAFLLLWSDGEYARWLNLMDGCDTTAIMADNLSSRYRVFR